MSHETLLVWLPIVLSAGLGGRLLGHPRCIGLGLICALFWIVLAPASLGATFWMSAWNVAGAVTGAAAIVALASWSGSLPANHPTYSSTVSGAARAGSENLTTAQTAWTSSRERCHPTGVEVDEIPGLSIAQAIEQYDAWLENHRNDPDPWPPFGEFIRNLISEATSAGQVRLFRVLSENDELVPVREAHPFVDDDWPSAREGIIGHVATTGRSYLQGDPTQGELVDRLAQQSSESPAWCFAVSEGSRRVGVVVVGRFDRFVGTERARLRPIERLVAHFWTTLLEVCRSRAATTRDATSGALIRDAFFAEAERVLADAYRAGEPCALAVIALEPLRHLNDTGRWDVADELVRLTSRTIADRMRSDDRLGRFDDSRFMFLLRRVDSTLASLIVEQLVARLMESAGDRKRWPVVPQLRCGLAGTGTGRPQFNALLNRALELCREARQSDTSLVSDLRTPQSVGV